MRTCLTTALTYIGYGYFPTHRSASVALSTRGCSELSHFREAVDELVGSDRIVAHADAGRVVDGVSYRRPHSTQAKFTHPLGLHRRGDRIDLVQKDYLLVRDIGM